ncbi:MAG: YfiT family bacillithiol transferase [Calditrichota bacterium]
MTDPRYPIGQFSWKGSLTPDERRTMIRAIAETPAKLRAAVVGLSEAQLDTSYRDDGWTARQVVHHVADSHLNAYVRLRLTLTEQEPIVKTWDEAAWAELIDARTAPVEISLRLIEALHERWTLLWESLNDGDFARTFKHPEYGVRSLDWLLAIYAWHGPHHAAHIELVRQKK